MKNAELELYTDYLLSSFGATTATGLSAMVQGDVSHDRITRFLSSQDYTSKDLWLQVKAMVREVQTAEGVLIFDDTIQEKAWTDESDLICWHYDHCTGRTVKGINLLNALYHCNGRSIPVAFELVKKPLQCDLVTRQEKRKSERTKNEMMRQMIHTCLQNALQFRFVLMDSWFSSEENFDFITSRGKHFIAALKSNRLVALSQEDWKKKRFVRVDELEFSEQGAVQGWLKGSARAVRLVRQVFTNKVSGQRWHLDYACRNMLRVSQASARRLPAMGQQLVDTAVEVAGQAREHVLEVSPRVVAMHPDGLHQAHDDSGALAGEFAAGE